MAVAIFDFLLYPVRSRQAMNPNIDCIARNTCCPRSFGGGRLGALDVAIREGLLQCRLRG